MERRRIEC